MIYLLLKKLSEFVFISLIHYHSLIYTTLIFLIIIIPSFILNE